ERRFKNRHGGTVAKPPHQALGTCWHDFPVLTEEAAVRCEEQDRTIEGAAVPFDDTDNQVDVVASRRPRKFVDCGARDVHAALPVPAKVLAALFRPRANHGTEVQAPRIGGDKCLRKKGELRAHAGRFVYERVNFLDSSLAIESDGSGLD